MKTFLQRIRQIFPAFLLFTCIAYAFIMLPANLFLRIYAPEDLKITAGLNTSFFIFVLVFYGFLRVLRFHPAFNKSYLTQLALSPWHIGKTLPHGPIHLFWADAVILGFLALLTLIFPVESLWTLLLAFIAAYVLGLFVSFCLAGQFGFAVLYLILAPLIVYPHLNPHIAILVLICLAVIGLWGVYSYLANFPWNTPWWNGNMIKQLKEDAINRRIIQWPFRELAPRNIFSMDFVNSVLPTVLAFWWIHVIMWLSAMDNALILTFYTFTLIAVILVRTIYYIGKYRPPISLLGRICTGRIIIPGYDKVYIAPIVILLTGILMPMVLKYVGLSLPITMEISFVISLFFALTLPPNFESWHYTGEHRISALTRQPMPTIKKTSATTTPFDRLFKGYCR